MKRTYSMNKAIAAAFASLMIFSTTAFAPVLANDQTGEIEKTEETGRVLCTTETYELAGAHDNDGKPCELKDHPAFAHMKEEEAVTIISVEENISHEAVALSCTLLHSIF